MSSLLALLKKAAADVPLKSSNLEAVGYNDPEKSLDVLFRNGGEYRYFKVPKQLFHRIQNVKSPGKFFYKHIKKDKPFQYEKLVKSLEARKPKVEDDSLLNRVLKFFRLQDLFKQGEEIPECVRACIAKHKAFSAEFLKDMDYSVPKDYEIKGDLVVPSEKTAAEEDYIFTHYNPHGKLKEKTAAADPSQTILITGHSGSGKSTLGKLLAERLGLPLQRIDAHPEFKEYVTNDDHGRWQKSLTPGTDEHKFYTDLVHKANKHTIDNSPAAAIIEGSQLGHMSPEELAKYKAYILVGGDPEQSIAQRIARSAKKKGITFSPQEILEKQKKARAVVDFWEPGMEKFRKLPGVIKYNHTEHQIEPLIKTLQKMLAKEKTAAKKDWWSIPEHVRKAIIAAKKGVPQAKEHLSDIASAGGRASARQNRIKKLRDLINRGEELPPST